jgi:hypothetical protein
LGEERACRVSTLARWLPSLADARHLAGMDPRPAVQKAHFDRREKALGVA